MVTSTVAWLRGALLAGVAFLVTGCRQEDAGLIARVEALQRANTEAAEVEAVAEIVRYTREENLQYGYRVRLRDSGRMLLPGELEKHLEDKLDVIIYLGVDPTYREMEWHPVANWYITRLVMP